MVCGGSWWPEVVGRAADHLGAAVSGAARFGRTDGSARPKRSLDDVVGFVDEILRDLGALGLRGLRVDDEFEVRAGLDGQMGGPQAGLQDLQPDPTSTRLN